MVQFSVKIVGKRSNFLETIAASIDHEIAQSKFKFPKKIKSITAPNTKEITDKLKNLSNYLNQNSSGLLFIIDEMGKFLEYAAQNDGDIFLFQEIF